MSERVKEAGFVKRLLAALCSVPGITVHRQNSGKIVLLDPKTGKRRAFVGAPDGAADISGILSPEGYRVEIETKTARGKLREAQVRWAAHIQGAGGLYLHATMLRGKCVEDSVQYWRMAFEDLIAQRRRGLE